MTLHLETGLYSSSQATMRAQEESQVSLVSSDTKLDNDIILTLRADDGERKWGRWGGPKHNSCGLLETAIMKTGKAFTTYCDPTSMISSSTPNPPGERPPFRHQLVCTVQN